MDIGQADPATRPVDARVAGRRRRLGRWLRLALVTGVVVLLALDYRSVTTTLAAAVLRALGASTGWLLLAGALTLTSMIAFGLLRKRTLAAAGGRIGTREAVTISYAAGAIHLTAPGGVLLSTGYVFRRLQRRGLPPAAITWSLAISGVLSSATLVALGVAGFAVGRASGSLAAFLPTLGLVLLVALAAVVVARRPDRVTDLVVRGLRATNRLLRRPADSGVLTVRATVADLLAIRPARLDWWVSVGAATANWLLDMLCLWACAHALGIAVEPWMLLTSYALAMAGAGVSPLPGGVGIVDGILVVALTAGAGAPAGAAVGAVLLYRVISLGSLLAAGWGAVGLQSLRSRSAAPAADGPLADTTGFPIDDIPIIEVPVAA